MTDPATCDTNVFADGHALLVCYGLEKEQMEELCARLKTSTLLFDWHFQGGVPILLYLGRYDQARAALEAQLDWINDKRWQNCIPCHDIQYWLAQGDTLEQIKTRQFWAIPASRIAESGAHSIGQIWHKAE